MYHRNLVACAAQTESLCGLILVAGRLANARTLLEATYPFLRLAVGVLNRLYVGSEETYKTRSAMFQLRQRAGFVEAMNAVRHAINWPTGPFVP